MTDGRSLESRVAALERELRDLRAEVRGSYAMEAAPPPVAPQPRAVDEQARAPRIDFETFVGRYGMLGLATLLALAAIGTFVSWAITRGLLGPTPRVIFGLIAAGAIAYAGLRLRPRSRSYGDSLLALALAAVHVCAWAAGPSLGLVPVPLALACCAAASVALGAFALAEADEALWCVGFGGACVAPFV